MNKKYLDDSIFYIEDFIDKESILILKKDIENQSLVLKEHEGLYHEVLSFSTKDSNIVWSNIAKKLEILFNNKKEYLYNFPTTPFIIKYVNRETKLTGWAMYPHSDNIDYDIDHSENTSNVLRGIVIYITDNFEGGEIVYVNKNIKFKPKAGYLVCHPGSEEYTHGVNIFSGGDRIIISAFVHERKKPN